MSRAPANRQYTTAADTINFIKVTASTARERGRRGGGGDPRLVRVIDVSRGRERRSIGVFAARSTLDPSDKSLILRCALARRNEFGADKLGEDEMSPDTAVIRRKIA